MIDNKIRTTYLVNCINTLLNNFIETHNQEDNVQNSKQRHSLNNEITKKETINQHKEDNTLGLDENILNQSNERIIYNESDKNLKATIITSLILEAMLALKISINHTRIKNSKRSTTQCLLKLNMILKRMLVRI